MDFSSITNQGLFDPAARYASPQVMPASAFASSTDPAIAAPQTYEAGHWYLNKATAANAIGTTALDPMVVLPDLRSDVCARIDNMLYGSSTVPVSTGASTDWANATTPADGGISALADVAGWAEGCVQTSDAKYVYFKVVQEN